jgi:hypothetical protein
LRGDSKITTWHIDAVEWGRPHHHAMKSITTKSDSSQPVADSSVYLFDDWFDPIEAAVRDRVRGFIQAMIEGELDEKLQRPRYGRRPKDIERCR